MLHTWEFNHFPGLSIPVVAISWARRIITQKKQYNKTRDEEEIKKANIL